MFRKAITVLGFALAILFVNRTDASIWTMKIGGSEYSGSGASSIASDAVVLTFNDSIVVGAVQLEVWFQGGTGVNAGAKLNDLALNLDPTKSITSFAWVSGVQVKSTTYSPNAINNDGSHGYDLEFNYPPPTNAPKLTPGLKSTYNIFGAGLLASSFDFTNVSGHGPFHGAVHINEINVGKSGHYADTSFARLILVPEPGTIVIWVGFFAMAVGFGYRKQIA